MLVTAGICLLATIIFFFVGPVKQWKKCDETSFIFSMISLFFFTLTVVFLTCGDIWQNLTINWWLYVLIGYLWFGLLIFTLTEKYAIIYTPHRIIKSSRYNGPYFLIIIIWLPRIFNNLKTKN
jgi:hypothetical protein